MIPPPFDYVAPATLDEAIALLGDNPDAKILAGGHSLIPLMRFRMAAPPVLVDINNLSELSYVREQGDWLEIGAMTRESSIDQSELIRASYPLLADTARVVADPLVRNMATLGGNIAHADPANDHPATMLAYDATVVATGPDGKREIAAREFFVDAFTTALAPQEILTEIRIPRATPGSGGAYFKLERKVGDFATAAVAVQFKLDDGKITSCGIGLTNVGLTPILAADAMESVVGKAPVGDTFAEAAGHASAAAEPIADHRGSEEYKRSLIGTLTRRAMAKAAERAAGGGA